jgi:hypothetical protein
LGFCGEHPGALFNCGSGTGTGQVARIFLLA